VKKVRDFLFLWGSIFVTVVWVAVIGCEVIGNFPKLSKEMGLNGIGDFVAGAMSPLAIFWLVMVYLQQRKEMREQVAQTEKIAEETKEQVKAMEKDLAIRHEPVFACDSLIYSKSSIDGCSRVTISIVNFGGVALHLHAKGGEKSEVSKFSTSRHVKTGGTVSMVIEFEGNIEEAKDEFIEIKYNNRFGVETKYQCPIGKGATKEDFFSYMLAF